MRSVLLLTPSTWARPTSRSKSWVRLKENQLFENRQKTAETFRILFPGFAYVSVIPTLCCPPVPPHTPSCEIPSGAVTGSVVQLRCRDQQSIPPATYSWFKDNQPISPARHANATFLINSQTGILVSVYR